MLFFEGFGNACSCLTNNGQLLQDGAPDEVTVYESVPVNARQEFLDCISCLQNIGKI
jgi:hypothetical protein